MLRLVIEVFLVDIDSIVLLHAAFHHRNQCFHCVLEVFVLFYLLAKALDIALFGEVDVFGPTSFYVLHTGTFHDDAFRIHFGFTAVRSRVNAGNDRFSLLVAVVVYMGRADRFEYLRFPICEIAVLAKFRTLLRIDKGHLQHELTEYECRMQILNDDWN